MEEKWKIRIIIARKKADGREYDQTFDLEVNPDEYVLDGIERIWAFHDRSLTYKHACHHSTCGACGMLVNGIEKLTCITPIREVTRNGGTLRIAPLRNFPVVSDLVVDTSGFFINLEKSHMSQVSPVTKTNPSYENNNHANTLEEYERLVDCIECGLCISACPAANTSETYMGPAIFAAIQHQYAQESDPNLLELADCHDGIWRCHSAYECSEVCPSNVDPGWRIMDLRKTVIQQYIKSLFSIKKATSS